MSYSDRMDKYKEMYEQLLDNDMVQDVLAYALFFKEMLGKDYVGLIFIPFMIFFAMLIVSMLVPVKGLKKTIRKMAFSSLILFFHSVCLFVEKRMFGGKELTWTFTLIFTSYEVFQLGKLGVTYNLWAKQINHYLSVFIFGAKYFMLRYYAMLIVVKINLFIYHFFFPDLETKKEKSPFTEVMEYLSLRPVDEEFAEKEKDE